MKVLWFTNIPMPDVHIYYKNEINGSGGWMGALLEELKPNDNIKLGVVTACQEYPDSHFILDDIEYYIINQKKIRFRPAIFPADNNPKYLNMCQKIIEEFAPDLIHIHGTERFYGNLVSLCQVKIPVLISIQGILEHYSKWFHWFGHLSMIDVIKFDFFKTITFRGQIWDFLEMKKRAAREKKMFVSCNNFLGRTNWDKSFVNFYNNDANYTHIDEVIRKPFWNHNWDISTCKRHRIAFLNPGHPRKGVELVLSAVNKLKDEYNDIQLYLIGNLSNDGYGRYIKKKISELGRIVKILGGLNAFEVSEVLFSSHVFVSGSFIDNSPNSIAEAQIVGIPVISSFTGGISSMIEDKKTGLLFPNGDIPSLCQKISDIFKNDDYTKSIGKNGQIVSRKRHDPNNIVDLHINVYKKLAAIK